MRKESYYEKKVFRRFRESVQLKLEKNRSVLEGTVKDYATVYAIGSYCHELGLPHIVNHLRFIGQTEDEIRSIQPKGASLDGLSFDIVILGGGVIGCAIADSLSAYDNLSVLLLEKEEDVAMGASSRNDGCIHVGFDLKTHSEKLRYLRRGRELLPTLCDRLGIPMVKTGQTVAFLDPKLKALYPFMALKSKKNKVPGGIRYLSKKALKEIEPNIGEEISWGIHFPDAASISPYLFTIALAEEAAENGVRFEFRTLVKGMEIHGGKITKVHTNRGSISAKLVINATGTQADRIARMANDETFSIHPRKGTDILFDKCAFPKLSKTAITVYSLHRKKTHTKGGGAIPTVDRNTLLGPDAIEVYGREDYAVPRSSIEAILAKHQKSMPALSKADIIAYFSGTRAATYEEDFLIRRGIETTNILEAVGIQSPGLTASPAIAERITELTLEDFPNATRKKCTVSRPRPIVPKDLSYVERNELVQRNSSFGHVICRCEEVTEGEILEAIHSPLHPESVDAIKRRTRAGMGRCQGGFCQMAITALLAKERGAKEEAITKKGDGRILLGDLKGEE